jgi:flavin-dependent dehydrogenase
MTMYDAIVVGARCAGSATAMLLALRGYRVLMVDRTSFPSDTMSTHWIHQPGLASLQRWDLLDRLRGTSAPPIRNVTFDFGPFALSGSPTPADGMTEALAPRRIILDQILIDAAVEAGAELREAFTVEELLSDGSRVTGIRGTSRSGRPVADQARIVVGADGMHSHVARLVDAPAYRTTPPLTSFYYSYWSGVETDGVEMYPRDGQGSGLIPTNDGLVCVGVVLRRADFHAFRADIEGTFSRVTAGVPGLAERLGGGRREERFVGTADQRNFLRTPYGPGWALVGDAGYNRDAITAQGISDAFRDAELLAAAIDDGLAGRYPLEEALAGYHRARDEAVLPMYELTCGLATLDPPDPQMAAFFQALAGNQADTDRFLGAIAGTVAIPDFFGPENVRRILDQAA